MGNKWIGLMALAALAGALRLVSYQQPAAPDDPSQRPIKYQPGIYFPDEFPLHGSVRLLTPPVVEMGQRVRIRVEYTAGDIAIEPGMAIEVWKHFTSDVEEFQVASPAAPAYFTAETTAPGVVAKTSIHTNWVQRNEVPVFPYRRCTVWTVEKGVVKKGDKVYLDLGGEKGVRMQHYEENLFNFRIAITRNQRLVGYGGDAIMKVTGGPLRKLRVQAPSVVKAGESFPVEVVPQDEWGSLAKNGKGLTLRLIAEGVQGGAFAYEEPLLHYVARDTRVSREGVVRLRVETADGQYRGLSNPVWVEPDPVQRVYYGELHQHTYLHDGRGVFDELYLYGRRVGLLDFGAVTPHHMPLSVTGPALLTEKRYPRDNWPELQDSTKRFNGWQDFVSLLGYEYSVGTNQGGHHNIVYNADRAKSTMELDPKEPAAPIGKMLRTVQLARVPTLVIPHIGGGPPDWSHPTDSRIERLFEVASVHGVFEESWQRHLKHGLRMGVIAAGDTHTSAMGTAYPGLIYVNSNGLAGVYATGKTRNRIWDGLYERRTFATTGNQRMVADFRVNGEVMGGEISSAMAKEARIEARISGAAPLVRVELVKNGEVIHALHPARNRGTLVRAIWGDNLYQRRAAVGMREGHLRASAGRLRLRQTVNLDQAFEEINSNANDIVWKTAAVSGDRDGFLADIAKVTGPTLHFRLDDSDTMGLMEAVIPLEQLKRDGYFRWSQKGKATHPYMEKMGVAPEFFLELELVNAQGSMDEAFQFQHREPLRPGDYFYLRAEQLDTNKLWTSPVWVN